jgi:hypothetical protein
MKYRTNYKTKVTNSSGYADTQYSRGKWRAKRKQAEADAAELEARALKPDATNEKYGPYNEDGTPRPFVSHEALKAAEDGAVMDVTIEVAYQDKDLDVGLVEQARDIWIAAADKAAAERVANGEMRDPGTCVMGAGIAVNYLPARARNTTERKIITQPPGYQGSLSWEGAPCREALAAGWMD